MRKQYFFNLLIMFIAKEGILDRMEQSFKIFKDNFLAFFLPIFLYKLFTVILFGALITSIVFVNILNLLDVSTDFFTFLNSSTMVMIIAVGMIGLILYLILYIPFLLGLIQSIKQASNNETVTAVDNIWYGFSRLKAAFTTYWYIFAYIALIPSLIFIVSGLFVISTFYFEIDEGLRVLGYMGGAFALILFGFFSIYRGNKATFALYNAVGDDDFSNENFKHSVYITDEKWWRIFGNFFVLSFIIASLAGLINGFISGFGGSSIFGSLSGLDQNNISIESVKAILDEYISNYSVFGSIFSSVIGQLISLVGVIFTIVFTFIFYRRLDDEYNPDQKVEIMTEENVAKRMEL